MRKTRRGNYEHHYDGDGDTKAKKANDRQVDVSDVRQGANLQVERDDDKQLVQNASDKKRIMDMACMLGEYKTGMRDGPHGQRGPGLLEETPGRNGMKRRAIG